MKTFKEYLAEEEYSYNNPVVGDYFAFEIKDDHLVESVITELHEDGIIVHLDEAGYNILEQHGLFEQGQPGAHPVDSTSPVGGKSVEEDHPGSQGTWVHGGYKVNYNPATFTLTVSSKDDSVSHQWRKNPTTGAYKIAVQQLIDRLEGDEEVDEAKYRGREVPLGKKMKGDVKKSKVYVRKPNGNIVKVNFGDPNMRIKKSNPKRRKSFRARHHCENPGPRWKARYWSCRSW